VETLTDKQVSSTPKQLPDLPPEERSKKRDSKHGEKKKSSGKPKTKMSNGTHKESNNPPDQDNQMTTYENQPTLEKDKTTTQVTETTAQTTSRNVITTPETRDLRKSLEEKSKKYAHLPVYDRQEELRKARERQAKMSAILSDMDKNLVTVTDLTSSHMESKGVTMVPSPTPFDDPPDDPHVPHTDVHTLRYNKGVLDPRQNAAEQSASQPQGALEKDDKSIKSSVIVNKGASQTASSDSDAKNQNISHDISKSNKSAKEPSESKVNFVESSETAPNNQDPNTTYESLGERFKELTERMEHVTSDLNKDQEQTMEHVTSDQNKEQEIPFADGPGESEDYTRVTRAANEDDELTHALTSALSLDTDYTVEKIQLEVSTSSLVRSQRKLQGTDTIHQSNNKPAIRRDFTDV